MKQTFKILDTGNFYFPLMQRGMKFRVLDTIDIEVKDKKIIEEIKVIEEMNQKYHFKYFNSRAWWDAIKQEGIDKEYKNCWIVPLFYDFFEDTITLHMDILQQVKGGTKNGNKK